VVNRPKREILFDAVLAFRARSSNGLPAEVFADGLMEQISLMSDDQVDDALIRFYGNTDGPAGHVW
jgi:hypothetical protein